MVSAGAYPLHTQGKRQVHHRHTHTLVTLTLTRKRSLDSPIDLNTHYSGVWEKTYTDTVRTFKLLTWRLSLFTKPPCHPI